jgi:hypothetical protein
MVLKTISFYDFKSIGQGDQIIENGGPCIYQINLGANVCDAYSMVYTSCSFLDTCTVIALCSIIGTISKVNSHHSCSI